MTLLILAQPGAIIDIYQERLIVAVICLNYSGDQETGPDTTLATGGATTCTLLVKWITPRGHHCCTPRWRSSMGCYDWLLQRQI